jgi:hypothetical protein
LALIQLLCWLLCLFSHEIKQCSFPLTFLVETFCQGVVCQTPPSCRSDFLYHLPKSPKIL